MAFMKTKILKELKQGGFHIHAIGMERWPVEHIMTPCRIKLI
jgi:hypothetical protein